MKTFTKQAAQGDLFISRIDAIPAGLALAKTEGGKFILAHSETGHNHVIEQRPNVRMYATDNPLLSYLEVIEATDQAEAVIEHMRNYDTHESLAVPPGAYEIRRQREYSPEGWRRVQD